MALVGSDISLAKGGRTLLDQVSVQVEPGRILGLLGPNGAGKTTLLRILSGEDHPDQGHIHIDDFDISGASPQALADRRALLPQQQTSAFNFTAYEVMSLGVSPNSSPNASSWIAQVADELHLSDLLGRIAGSLSGGELQRVRLGRALLQLMTTNAKYLLLDEPTSAQDPGQAAQLASIFRQRARQNDTGILVIVHDLNLAISLCDDIVLLKDGRVIASGSPTSVLSPSTLTHAYGRGLACYEHDGRLIVLPSIDRSNTRV